MIMIKVQQLNINVEKSGNGRSSIILLPGWGQSTKIFADVNNHLMNAFTVYNIDLPGFGLSDKPNAVFNTMDYANIVRGIIEYFEIKDPIILGHSFGGRVAIKYTAIYKGVKKLILVDSAGIVPKKKFSYYLRVYTFKFLRRLFSLPLLKLYKEQVLKKFGSSDYKNADDTMKKVLVKVVNEDLRKDLYQILCPTLLIWGTEDDVTPISDAYLMKEHLYDAGIVKLEKGGHYSFLDNNYLFLSVLDVFLTPEK